MREEAGATRSQHVVHVLPRDNAQAARLITGAAERATRAEGIELMIVVPTTDDAVALARALLPSDTNRSVVVPITSVARARRQLQRPTGAIAGTPADLVALLKSAALKPATLRSVTLLWLDEMMDDESRGHLEVLLAELPKEAERIVAVTSSTAATEHFLEGFMWRARRVSHLEVAPLADAALRYVSVAGANRGDVLRGLLDAFDPEKAVVSTFTDAGESEARHAVALLGYAADNEDVAVIRGAPAEEVPLLIIYDDVPNADALHALAGRSPNVIALVAPSRLEWFRGLAGPGATSLTFTSAFQSARSAEDQMRDELRSVIANGGIAAHVLQLESLCEAHDAVEVAAAALFLLQRERQRARRAATAAAPAARVNAPPAAPAAAGFTRLYLNIGERDGVRRGDIVGAITGEAGITGTQIGKIDLRDTHTIVEIANDVAARVIEKLGGAMIRGRRIVAREDRQPSGAIGARGARGERGERGERGSSGNRGDRGDRPARRGKPRRDFDTPRGDDPRSGRGERGTARDRPDPLPRAARESEEWTERGERLRHARGRLENDQ